MALRSRFRSMITYFFFFNDTATTEIYTLSLHDALPILRASWPGTSSGSTTGCVRSRRSASRSRGRPSTPGAAPDGPRSEEHTSELQSRLHLVCRLLLEKKKTPASAMTSSRCVPPPYDLY